MSLLENQDINFLLEELEKVKKIKEHRRKYSCEYYKKYRENCREKINNYGRNYYEKNKERISNINKENRCNTNTEKKKNGEEVRQRGRPRRAYA
jgi:hypothetical protein